VKNGKKGKKRPPFKERFDYICVFSVYAHLSWNVFVGGYSMVTHDLSRFAEFIGIIWNNIGN